MTDASGPSEQVKSSSSEPDKGSHYFALPVGTSLHEYTIEELLGHGGFGITYRAVDTILRESVAIKEYLPNEMAVRVSDETVRAKSQGDDRDFQAGLKSFLEEARVITRFRHPNIVHVRRFFELHGTGYIALDYERGQTLSKRLASGPIPEAELRDILGGLLDGLETIHDQAVLHRDIKPSNVILRENGTPVLIDFGAARDFGERHSRSITAIAAPGYSPPEQYGVGEQQGPWTDFYALGAIAYKCVTGNAPVDSLRRLRNDPLVPASKAAAGKYSREMLRAIDWMLAIEEGKRPHTAQQLRDMLGFAGSGRSRGVVPVRRRRIALPAVAAALGVIVAIGAVTVYNKDLLRLVTEPKVETPAPAPVNAAAPAPVQMATAPPPPAPAAEPAAATPPTPQAAAQPTPAQASPPPPPPARPAGPDDLAWDFVKDSSDADQFKLFLQQFPASSHRDAANAKLAALGQPGAAARPSPAATAVPTPSVAPVTAPAPAVSPPPAPAATVTPPPAAAPPSNRPGADDLAWDIFKDTDDVALLQQFIERFPASRHRAEAQSRIAALQSAKTARLDSKPAEAAPSPKPAQPTQPVALATPVTDTLSVNEIRSRLYELNFDTGPANRMDLLQQAVREYEATLKVAQTGQLTAGLLQQLRQTAPLQPWGSIVYARATEKWGMSWGHETRREAVAGARATCGEACPVEISFFGKDCAAFAHSDTSWAIVSRPTVEAARTDALSDCRKNNRACTIVAAVCANGGGRGR